MAANEGPGSDEPRSDAEAVLDPSESGISTTAARALSLGAALAAPQALRGLRDDLVAIGIERLPDHWGGWASRARLYSASDDVLRRYLLLDEVRDREVGRWAVDAAGETAPTRVARVDLWRDVALNGRQPDAIAWLRTLLTDTEPVSAAAAAAALSSWKRVKDVPVPAGLDAAREVLPRYAESSSPQAQAIARSALATDNIGTSSREPRPSVGTDVNSDAGSTTSILVHGTGAWANTWWYPGGDFHSFARQNLRPDLYSAGDPFSWSGSYKRRHREVAAERLADWVIATIDGPVNALFAHSYGGTIALMATTCGVAIGDLVLLSAPAENVRVEWRNITRAISLRIHMDLVLLAARRAQTFTENVEEYHLPHWFWYHHDSHDPAVWKEGAWAETLGLVVKP